jgi:DNA-binding CsgD family transcriptional regulator
MSKSFKLETAFSTAVDRLYAAATDGGSWEAAMESVCDCIGARAADVTMLDPGSGQVSWFQPARVDEFVLKYVAEFQDDLMNLNPRIPVYMGLDEGGCVADSEVWTLKEKARMPFFGEMILPWGIHNSLMAFAQKRSSGWMAVAAHYDKNAGIPQAEQRQRLQMLLPHLRRAYSTYVRLNDAQRTSETLLESLDRIGQPVAVIDHGGRVLRANRLAADIFRGSRVMFLQRDGSLAFLDSKARAGFLEALARCDARIELLATHAGSPPPRVIVNRPAKAPFLLSLCPLGRQEDRPRSAAALLFVNDPEAQPPDRSAILQAVYRLTPAEARLAQAVFEGQTLREFAESRAVSYETARAQLKAALAKTGVRRQSDLVRLIGAITV